MSQETDPKMSEETDSKMSKETKPNNEPIKVWPFHDAPDELRSINNHGGDEDWLALVPPNIGHQWIGWMESGTPFGYSCVSEEEHPTKKGYYVVVGSH